jgi:hypothetical protein
MPMRQNNIYQRIFQKLLNEEAGKKRPAIPMSDIGMIYVDGGGLKAAFIYDAKSLVSLKGTYASFLSKGEIDAANRLTNSIAEDIFLGIVDIKSNYNPCNDAWQISAIAGPGYGYNVLYPLAFAMSPTGELSPDREVVMDGAKGAWRTMFSTQRNKAKLDYLPPNNKTPQTEDDCGMHYPTNKDPNVDYLNHSYSTLPGDKALFNQLKNQHQIAMDEVFGELPSYEQEFSDLIQTFADKFWYKHYHAAVAAAAAKAASEKAATQKKLKQ